MSTFPTIDRSNIKLLHPFFAAATADASAAMCRWTNGLIALSLDEICEISMEEVACELEIGDERLTMVVLSLDGELGGTMVLTFDDYNGRRLAATLLNREVNASEDWSILEQSALMETGNILSCAYMNALTRLIDAQLVPSPPHFVQDFGASVLEQALLEQAGDSDAVTVCRTQFKREGEALNWNVIFVPATRLRQRLMSALKAE